MANSHDIVKRVTAVFLKNLNSAGIRQSTVGALGQLLAADCPPKPDELLTLYQEQDSEVKRDSIG
jgi:hypothetical protein